jgi:hypothetical protein
MKKRQKMWTLGKYFEPEPSVGFSTGITENEIQVHVDISKNFCAVYITKVNKCFLSVNTIYTYNYDCFFMTYLTNHNTEDEQSSKCEYKFRRQKLGSRKPGVRSLQWPPIQFTLSPLFQLLEELLKFAPCLQCRQFRFKLKRY